MIQKRTQEFWEKNQIWPSNPAFSQESRTFKLVDQFLTKEYNSIPEKERIGKGLTYIVKAVASGLFKGGYYQKYYHSSIEKDSASTNLLHISKTIINFTNKMLSYAETNKKKNLLYLGIHLFGEIAGLSEKTAQLALSQVEKWVEAEDWEIRENSLIIIRKALKQYPELTFHYLKKWSESPSENLRRSVAEGTRPMRDIPWLRNPEKNKAIFDLLFGLRADSHVYVRKAVGNNLKDLSKYMPAKVLRVCTTWLQKANIQVTNDLASKTKQELDPANFYLIWTLKHGLRWLQARHPEYHPQLQKLLGSNYIAYFHEKHNFRASTKK